MGCHEKHLLKFPNLAENGKTPVPLAFRHDPSALINKLTTTGNRPVGSIQ
jgi:hypothetical protein